jgi:hypothetical protein
MSVKSTVVQKREEESYKGTAPCVREVNFTSTGCLPTIFAIIN